MKTSIITLPSIILQKMLSLVHCLLCVWKSSQASIFFNITRGESMELLQKLGPNRVKSSNVLESVELDKNNEQLQQEPSACRHFFDNTEMENGRHRVFNFKLSKLDPNEVNDMLKGSF